MDAQVPLDPDSGIILNAPLMGWINFPLKSRLMNDFHVPVTIDNDCNLGALAEQRCGLAKGKENVIYVTVSTGVGAGIVIGGKIYHGKSGGAGEFGHLSIFAPDVIIIGGGVSKSHALFENAMRKSIKEHTIGHIDDGRTIFSEMCDRVVLYGAYYLISEKVKGE